MVPGPVPRSVHHLPVAVLVFFAGGAARISRPRVHLAGPHARQPDLPVASGGAGGPRETAAPSGPLHPVESAQRGDPGHDPFGGQKSPGPDDRPVRRHGFLPVRPVPALFGTEPVSGCRSVLRAGSTTGGSV